MLLEATSELAELRIQLRGKNHTADIWLETGLYDSTILILESPDNTLIEHCSTPTI